MVGLPFFPSLHLLPILLFINLTAVSKTGIPSDEALFLGATRKSLYL